MVRARDAMKRRDDGTRWDRAPPRDGGREPIARAPQRARSSRGTVDAMKRTREIGRVGGERAGVEDAVRGAWVDARAMGDGKT